MSLLKLGSAAVAIASKQIFASTKKNFLLQRIVTNRQIYFLKYDKDVNAGTMADVKNKMMNATGIEPGYTLIPKSREYLTQYEPKLEDLPPRSMEDSYTSAIVPLGSDKQLQDRYVAFLGHVRLGRLMEDMDMMAVWVCHQHLKIPNLDEKVHLPYTFVTILVDKVDFTEYSPKANQDIRISGHVSWVGKSSMEIVVWLEQLHNGVYEKITRALFLMAARNATNTKAAPVNPLALVTDEEKKIFAGGEARKKRRQQLQNISLLKVEPNDYEQMLMHTKFMKTIPKDTLTLNVRSLPANSRWMTDTCVINTMASFPENRNAHNKVFGGFLMKNALEISWVCAYMFCGARPMLEHICDISFAKAVDVSSFIKMTAYVVYTELNYCQIMTVADSTTVGSFEQHTSNVFYYTFKCAEPLPEIIPRSYHEAMWFIEGRRKFNTAKGLDNANM